MLDVQDERDKYKLKRIFANCYPNDDFDEWIKTEGAQKVVEDLSGLSDDVVNFLEGVDFESICTPRDMQDLSFILSTVSPDVDFEDWLLTEESDPVVEFYLKAPHEFKEFVSVWYKKVNQVRDILDAVLFADRVAKSDE